MLKIYKYGTEECQQKINFILKRLDASFSDLETPVIEILKRVKNYGDDAIVELTKEYEGITIDKDELQVSEREINYAYGDVEKNYISALRTAIENIYYFHEKQKRNSWFLTEKDGVVIGQKIIPLERVGLYVPGGKSASPSSVLMNAIPAKVAGVQDMIMVTPPGIDGINPYLLVTAKEVGITNIFKVGGPQAIAALAFGTEHIPKVDKIVGPGDVYIALAKKNVYGLVDVDMLTGPTETIILADETANPSFIIADIISQAEQEEMSYGVLITPSETLAKEVSIGMESGDVIHRLSKIDRRKIVEKSLSDYGAIILTETIESAINLVNFFAPEQLEVMTANPWELLNEIKNAGIIFMGSYSPAPIGEYLAGINNIVPSGGTVRFHSPLGVDDFLKKSNVLFYSRKRLEANQKKIIRLAEAEGLFAHAEAIRKRFE